MYYYLELPFGTAIKPFQLLFLTKMLSVLRLQYTVYI